MVEFLDGNANDTVAIHLRNREAAAAVLQALVFFRDAEAPVRCALELSQFLRTHFDLKLRMGIHSGPVYRVADINANRNVAGGGINIAQRVMDSGDAGHILVSSAEAEVLATVTLEHSGGVDLESDRLARPQGDGRFRGRARRSRRGRRRGSRDRLADLA